VTGSIGIFLFSEQNGLSEHHAMVGADYAMYAAKHGGRDRHAPFTARTLEDAEAMLLTAPVARPADPASTNVPKH